MFIFYILIFILVLGTVVLVHELGHFIFAKRAGILCHEFSIGMGPAIYKFKRGETVYAIRAIPIGGYVSAAGEDPNTSQIKKEQIIYLELRNNLIQKIHLNSPEGIETKHAKVVDFDLYGKEGNPLFITYDHNGSIMTSNVSREALYVFAGNKEIQIAPYDRCYESKPWLRRFLFVVMGAGFNFILATLIFIMINFITGIPTEEPILSNPNESSMTTPAIQADFKAGDRILKLDNVNITKWQDISDFMADFEGGALNITIDRDGDIFTKEIYPLVSINTIGIISDLNTSNDTVIGAVSGNSRADKEGLEAGDQITSIEGVAVSNWSEVVTEFSKYYDGEKEISITYVRNGVTKTVGITGLKALDQETVSSYSIGISPVSEFKFFASITGGVKRTIGVIGEVFGTLGLLFTNDNVGVSDLSGPIGIFDMTKTFAMGGFLNILFWVAFISANIGFVNLLPFPALDGGRLIFLVIEGVTGKTVNRKVEGYIHGIGFMLFMVLFIYITMNDIIRLRM